ncbi:MAG: sigma 54-interacting transcriptional regulator [Myxococcales bacterium]|nr:sigma 54-interacting transcriptional regulator [Myxococcales bacterium]
MSNGTQRMSGSTGVLGTDAGGNLVLRRVVVRVVSGPDRGKEVLLEQGTLLVGSHPEADLVLTDGTVSRYHAELALMPEGIRIRDLKSTNGTFVGDSRIEAAVVAPGSEVRLGRTRVEMLPADVPMPEAPSEHVSFGRLVGAARPMRQLFGLLEKVAASDAPILIFGEAGVGKSEAARAVHEASARARAPYVELDLRGGVGAHAIGEEMARANGGTVVLDHVDESPVAIQDALAMALDRRERGVIDVRPIAIAATDLRDRVEAGALRRDLWFSLASLRVRVPPLRERREDLPRLVRDLVRSTGYPDVGLTAAELGMLRAHEFPGNVRELRRMIEQTLLSSDRTSRPPSAPGGVQVTEDLVQLPFKEAKEKLLDVFEARYIEALLARHQGNVSRAAQEAGVDRNHLARLARKHGLR